MPCRYKSARKLDQTEIIHIRSKQLSSWPMSGICKCDILLLMTSDCLGMSSVPGVTFHIKRNHLDDKCSWEIQCFGGFGQPVPQAQMVSIRLSLQNGWMRNTGKHPSRWQIIANQIPGTCWRHSLIDCFTAYRLTVPNQIRGGIVHGIFLHYDHHEDGPEFPPWPFVLVATLDRRL